MTFADGDSGSSEMLDSTTNTPEPEKSVKQTTDYLTRIVSHAVITSCPACRPTTVTTTIHHQQPPIVLLNTTTTTKEVATLQMFLIPVMGALIGLLVVLLLVVTTGWVCTHRIMKIRGKMEINRMQDRYCMLEIVYISY